MPTTIFSDTFTDTNGTDLAAHTPNVGTSWAYSGSGGTYAIQSNTCVFTRASTAYAWAIATGSETPNDCTVEALVPSSSGATGLVFCWTDSSNHYGYRYNVFSGQLEFYKVVSGTETTVSVVSFTPSGAMLFKVIRSGSAIEFYRDGSIVSGLTQASQSELTGGKAGLASLIGSGTCDYDNFSWVDDTATTPFRPYYITG